MELQRLTIDRFKGISHFDHSFDGNNTNIYGANATGKTTIYDAFLWLLFGKDSTGRKDFEVKPLGPDGEPQQQGSEVSVEASVLHNGRAYVLRRCYAEKWTRKRGEPAETLTGHETRFFVDGLPVLLNQYQDIIDRLIPEQVFKLITNPYHFNVQLKWQERRAILTEVCGNITDADVLSTSADFLPLSTELSNHTVDELKQILAVSHRNINGELKALPTRIDEASKAIQACMDADEIGSRIVAAKDKKAMLESSLVKPDIDALEAESRKLISLLVDWDSQNRAHESAQLTALEDDKRARMAKVQDQIDGLKNSRPAMLEIQSNLESLLLKMQNARAQWERVNAEEWAGERMCAACNRPFDEGDIAAAIEAFNLHKSDRLNEITQGGQAMKADTGKLSGQIAALEESVRIETTAREGLLKTMDALRAEKHVVEAMPGYQEQRALLLGQKASIDQQIIDAKAGVLRTNEAALSQIREADEEIAYMQQQTAILEQNVRTLSRIEDLTKQQKQLAAELERTEKLQYLCEQFSRAKASMVQERVNGKFRIARFKLFDEQINGGLADTCEAVHEGVPYSDINHAMQINIGLDIITTLSKHYGYTAPVFIDNAESVVELTPMDCQMIRLVVSAEDTTLRIEKEAQDGGTRISA